MSELAFWYYCDSCHTEWETVTKEDCGLNNYPCSYCGETTTRFIGWSDEDSCYFGE
ncbi:hypothetical protein AB9_024 [Acinetobacter phage vB_AbaM_B9]|nr:hypothetical protein AB9_024 [Acinetobacter phage vB_AbaM_B9]